MKKILAVLLGVLMMFGLFGCSAQRYRVVCDDLFTGVRASYKKGEKVELQYSIIASDTNYSFYVDGAAADVRYDDQKGYIISFVMPAHDVEVSYTMDNTMAMPVE